MNSNHNNMENELNLEEIDDDPKQKSPDEVFDVIGKYPKLPGGGGSAGTDFQIKLLLYCLLKGYKFNEDFRLSTENQTAGNFDDVVYETVNCRFLIQAKHKENDTNQLGFNELFPKQNDAPNTNTTNEDEEKPKGDPKGDFNIYKYLNAFHNIKNGDKVNALILCTNLRLNSKTLDTALKAEMKKIGITTDSTDYIITNNDISENHIFKHIKNITCLSLNEKKVGEFIKKKSIAKLTGDKIDQFVRKLQIISIGDTVLDNHIKKVSKQIELFPSIPEDMAFPFLCEKIKLWLQCKEGLFLNRHSAKGYICSMRSQSYINSVKNDIPISFKKEKEEIEQYTKLFIEEKAFYKAALIKILKDLQSEESKILFLNPEDPWKIQSQFLKAFELPEYVSLILPLLVLNKYTENIINDVLNLTKTIEAREYKKIIIVTFNNNKFTNKFANKFEKTLNYVLTFSELSDESQAKILEKEITFQDKKMSIRNIYEPHQDKMNGAILLEFLTKKNAIINGKYSNEENLKRFYIKRNIRISNKTNSKSVNLFSSFNKNVRSKSDIISEINFCQLILEEDNKKSNSNKFILLSDIPGMGKSALLSSIELTIRKTCYWVIKLNLRYCTQILFNALQENMESVDIQKLLPKINSTHQNIFELPDKVILLIDSLDEIAPDYTDIILNTLINTSRSSNIKKIIMASRPHVLQRIVYATNAVVYEVDPFTNENSQTFIFNYWKSKLNLDHQQDKAKLYLQHLFKSLKHNVGFDNLIGIPLQTKMIAEVFVTGYKDENIEWLGCEEYLKNDEMLFPKMLTISKLYDMFIDRKREVYIHERRNAQGNIDTINQSWKTFDEALKTHTAEALKLLFAEKHHKHFDLLETKPNIDMDTLLKMGIIVNSDEHVEFIHQTFAEYFVAKYFCILIEESNNLSSDLIKFLINNIILMFTKRGTIVLFMEHLLRLNKVKEDVFDRFALMTELSSNQTELEVLATQGYFNMLTLLIKKYRYPKELLFPIVNDNTFLHLAVKHNAIDFAKLLVEKGDEVNEKNSNGQIPLHIAFNNYNKEMIPFLLQKGSNICVKDCNDNTLLHYAARTNNTKMATYLIINQPDVTVYNSRRETPLHHAIANRANEMFQFLLENRHSIDVKDDRDDTLLHYAAKSGNCNMAASLIEKRHEIDLKNLDGQYPLHYAIKYRKKDMTEYLLEKYENVNYVKDKDGNTLLHYTAQFNQTEIAEILISKGHEVNIENHRGQTPIHFAFIRKNKRMIYLLLKNNHKTNVLLPDGNSLLHAAAKLNDCKLAKVLVDAKHPINEQNSRQETPLHIAISLGNKQMIDFLSTKNYDNTLQDKDGNTLLHIAARKGDLETAQILMKKVHEINVINERQETPLHLAIACRCSKLCTLLLKKGHRYNIRDKELNTVLHLAAKLNDVELAEEYNKHVHDLNVVNNTNKSPLFLAVINQHEEMTNFLLNNGHRVNIRDSYGNTLLHFAAKNNNIQIASLLIEKLRQINVQNENGFTPLHFAVFYKCQEMSKFLLENDHSILDEDYERNRILHIAAKMDEIVTAKLLIEKKHKLNVENRYGETPLYVAVFNNSTAVTEYLLAVDNNLEINDKYTDADDTLLHVAVENNNVKLVNLLKQKGHSINIKNAKGQTPLHIAIANKYRNILESLITEENNFEVSNENTLLHCAAENNAFQIADLLPIHKINEKDSNGHTALYLAIKNNSKQMFDFLIDKGAQITDTDNDGNTLLHCAAFNNNLEAAVVLVTKDHPINIRNLNDQTPLHCLITRSVEIYNRIRQIDIIILLLNHDHTIDVKDEYGNTLLHFAAKFNGTELANILINQKNHKLQIPNDNGQTPLHLAIANSSIETTKLLLNFGENISTTDKDGNTLLHYAAKVNDIQTLTLLIFKGYSVNAGNRFKQTLLDFLVQLNHKILVYLLRHGLDPNIKLRNGNTILHLAAEKNNTDLADVLLNLQLSVNVTNSKRQTPLHISIKNKSRDMSKLLLNERHHMEVEDVKDEFGNTLLHYAAKEDDVEIAGLLLDKKHGIDVENLKKESPLHIAIESKAKRMIQLLLDRGQSIEAKDINKNTLLHLAAKANNTDLALLLIKRNHEINVSNNNNETPLFLSVSRKFKEMTKLLLENKHSTNYCVFGNTLLHTAVANDDVEIAKLLIENGLKVDVQNKKGETPFYFAIKHKRKNITNFLFNQDNNPTINAEIAVSLVNSITYIKSNISFSISRDFMILRYNRMSILLLENKNTIIVKDEHENTLLHLVSEANDTKVGDLLIRRGHDINKKNAFKMTPLYVASINNSKEMCRLLLEQDKIDIHCLPDDNKDSLLHLAVEQNDLRRVDLLLKRNHDVNGKNSNEETPLLIASKKRFIHIIKRLLQHDRIKFDSIKDEEGYTLLHLAAEVNNTELADLLLTKGQTTNIKNIYNDTPLHIALRFEFENMVERLVSSHTGDFNHILDKKGNTLLHFAVDRNNFELVRLLIQKNHKIPVMNGNLETPVHIAFNKKYISILKLLLKNTEVDFKNIVDTNNINLVDFAADNVELKDILMKNQFAFVTD